MTGSCPTLLSVLLALVVPALLAGCPPADPPLPLPPPAGPCDDVSGAAPAAGRIYADASASEGGDGSAASPFPTLDEAIAEARATGVRSIVLAPGEYSPGEDSGRYTLSNNVADWLDSDLEIAGCGREETLLVGVEAEEQVGDELVMRLQPVFDITGDTTTGIHVHDLAVVGARRGIIVRLGAGASGPIVLERVDVLDSLRMGVLVDGSTTVAHLLDVLVDGVESEDGEFGWGIGVQTGMWLLDDVPEPTVLQDVVVTGVQGFGVLADGGWVEITDTEVTDVAKVDDLLGRGVQLQQWTRGTLEDVTVSGASDASIFLESPGRMVSPDEVHPVEVYDCVLGPTLEASLPGVADETAADGLVATQWLDPPSGAGDYLVVVDGTELVGNPRTHVLADAVTMEVGADNIFGEGTGYPLASQGGAVVQGIGGGEPGYPPVVLSGAEALELNREPVVLDDLSAD